MTIDLRSDTVTRPGAAMRRAIADAEVGDDVLEGDPTTRRLEARVAELLGKEDALFCPSGTMANQVALWLLGERGTEVLLDSTAHILDWELAGAATLAGLQVRPVAPIGPLMDAEALERTFRVPSDMAPRASLVCIENTHNGAGGMVTPLAGMQRMRDVARRHGCRIHLDGARLWNASVASGTPLHDFAACADTVMVSLTKGIGAPVGAVLAGSREHIVRGREVRKRFGGGMRQSGILAAAALYGLEHHLPRIVEDHAKAADFASIVDGAIAATVVPPETNIVMIDLTPGLVAGDVVRRAADAGVRVGAWSPTRVRAVMHLDVSDDDARRAGEAVLGALDEAWRALGDTSEFPVVVPPHP
jgi:threonine aldolase